MRGVPTVAVDAHEPCEALAQRLHVAAARFTLAADQIEVRGDAATDELVPHLITLCDDASDELVARHPRKGGGASGEVAVDVVEDGQADAAGLDVDEHLIGSRLGVPKLLEAGVVAPSVDPVPDHRCLPRPPGGVQSAAM